MGNCCVPAPRTFPPGLKRQDNDLIVIENAEAAAAFKRAFDAGFAGDKASRPVIMTGNAI
jgi:hypothetical protein